MTNKQKRRQGITSAMAMLFLTLFATLALGFFASVTTSVEIARNDQRNAPRYESREDPRNYGPVPAQLTIKPGTYITVRLNQALSSDHNHAGDAFAASLVRPIVVDGVVVAGRGQTLGGRVAEAQKAGRVSGTSLTLWPAAMQAPVDAAASLVRDHGFPAIERIHERGTEHVGPVELARMHDAIGSAGVGAKSNQ